jgi:PAS domain S-box-containing protein
MSNHKTHTTAASTFTETTCPYSGLPVVSSPEFTNVNIGGDYLLTVKKFGESIVYNDSVGNYKYLKADQYNPVIEDFCEQTGVKEPFVRIIDFRHATGRISLKQLKLFTRYFLSQEGKLAGVVFLKGPTWLRPFIDLAVKIYNPSIQAVSASDDKESIDIALQIIAGKTAQNLPAKKTSKLTAFSFNNIQFKPEWDYTNPKTGFRFRSGCIPQQLLFVSLHGYITGSDDIINGFSKSKKATVEGQLQNIPYILVDFSDLINGIPFRLKRVYASEAIKATAQFNHNNAIQIIIGPGSWIKAAVKLYTFLENSVNRTFYFADTVKQAFDLVNNFSSDSSKLPELTALSEEGVYITPDNLEELNRVFAALLWEEDDAMSEIHISPENPLGYLTETLELLKQDIIETRDQEIEEQRTHLAESERNRKRLLSLMKDNQAVNLALNRNLAFQQLISDLSTAFVKTTDDSFDECIDYMLHKTGPIFDADRSYLFLSPDNLETISNTHEWCSQGTSPQKDHLQDLLMDDLPWLKSQLLSKSFCHIPDVDKLPPEVSAEKQHFLAQEIQSILFVPIKTPARIHGLIGFDALKKPFRWTEEQIQGLKVLANIVGELLQKKQHEKELQAVKDDLHKKILEIINNLDIALWSMDLDGNYLFMNDATETITGYTVREWYETPALWKNIYPKEVWPVIIRAREELMTTGYHERQQQILTKKGEKKTVKIIDKLVYGPNGHPFRIDSTSTDITEIIQYQKRLEHLNEELNAFSYTISHDLRAPLRSIEGFSQIITEEYGSKLDDTGKDYLMRIRRSTQKMSSLINDLLELSRFSKSEIIKQPINLSKIAESIKEMLLEDQDMENIRVNFIIEPDLKAFGDLTLIKLALQNLLQNALKYSMKEQNICIEFKKTIYKGKQTFYVRDNGVGFNMKYAYKLFLPFQRLHSESEFIGNGVGLNIVKRIINKHEGDIWAESIENEGSTFYFTLE